MSKESDGTDGTSESGAEKPDQNALDKQIGEALSSILQPAQVKQAVGRVMTVIRREDRYSGPIPHPEHLAKYEAVLTGAADRILSMA